MEDDRRIDQDDVVALLHHRLQPAGADVVFRQHAVVAVVEGRTEAAVDLRGREDEPAPAAQGDDLVHGHVVGHEADTLTTWASRRAGARSRGTRREAGPASATLGSARRTRGSSGSARDRAAGPAGRGTGPGSALARSPGHR